jgi:phosphoglycerate kinase
MLKDIKEEQLYNKRVLVRVDYNVPMDKDGQVLDDFRIVKTLPTLKHLIEEGAKIILISHIGRPKEGEKLSLHSAGQRLGELLGQDIIFVKDCLGKASKKAVENMQPKEIVLLENVRFYSQETNNDEEFARELASLGEFYVNDAFSISHREHASMVGIPKFLPSVAGLLLKEEITTLDSILERPKRPLVAILGGAKLETKLPCILRLLELADHVLIGGMLAPVILAIKKISLSSAHFDKELEKKVLDIKLTNPKLHLPIDALVGLKNLEKEYLRQSAVGKIRQEEQMFDIGPETVRMFSDVIEEAGTIIWNGPLGYTEDERFSTSTLSLASSILRNPAFSVVGGGDTVSFLAKNNLRDKFGYTSTGGGAMLEYLSGKKLPGIKAIENE